VVVGATVVVVALHTAAVVVVVGATIVVVVAAPGIVVVGANVVVVPHVCAATESVAGRNMRIANSADNAITARSGEIAINADFSLAPNR
jgi:hypothetical protein